MDHGRQKRVYFLLIPWSLYLLRVEEVQVAEIHSLMFEYRPGWSVPRLFTGGALSLSFSPVSFMTKSRMYNQPTTLLIERSSIHAQHLSRFGGICGRNEDLKTAIEAKVAYRYTPYSAERKNQAFRYWGVYCTRAAAFISNRNLRPRNHC